MQFKKIHILQFATNSTETFVGLFFYIRQKKHKTLPARCSLQ